MERVLDTVLADAPAPRRVLDPSCGDGRFLAAAAVRWPAAELHGVDVDAGVLADARQRLGEGADLRHGDGLGDALAGEDGGFDLVIGNPPFLSQLARRTSRGGRSAVGGGVYADAAALFLARAVALVRPDGGRVALVLPQSVLATRDAATIRAGVADVAAVDALWIDDEGVFDASVHTVVLGCVRGADQGPVRRWLGRPFERQADAPGLPAAASWSPLLADVLGGVPVLPVLDGPVLGSVATATADFRDQYYGLVGHVVDDLDPAVGPALVTSGLIDPGSCAWGRRPLRFAGARYAAPRVSVGELTPALQAWAARRLVPKVLVATQTAVVEACADERGELLPGVPVLSVVPHDPVDVWPLTAALCSPVVSAWAAQLTMGAGLSTTAVRLRARQVVDVPLPVRPSAAVDRRAAGRRPRGVRTHVVLGLRRRCRRAAGVVAPAGPARPGPRALTDGQERRVSPSGLAVGSRRDRRHR